MIELALTPDEIFDVVSDLTGSIAEKLRDEETPGNLSKKEILELVQQLVVNMLGEITD